MEKEKTTAVTEEAAVNTAEIVQGIKDEFGVIAKETRVTGNIKTDGHIVIEGSVRGNITAKGNVVVLGSVSGNISCNNPMLQQGNLVNTEITATGHVAVENGIKVEGKIKCRSISIYGEVKGEVEAEEAAEIGPQAVLLGSITAGTLGIQFGAKVSATMKIAE